MVGVFIGFIAGYFPLFHPAIPHNSSKVVLLLVCPKGKGCF